MVIKKITAFKVEIETTAWKSGNGAAIPLPKEFEGHKVRATVEIID